MTDKEFIKAAIDQLEEFHFLKTIDRIAEYSANADIYYKQIDEQRFIIFHHFNKNKLELTQGFDCWISTYEREIYIGKLPAIEMETVKTTFDFREDWKLIKPFLFQ